MAVKRNLLAVKNMYNPKEQLFAEEISKRRYKYLQIKHAEESRFQAMVEKERKALDEETAGKGFFRRLLFLNKLQKTKNYLNDGIKNRISRYKKSDNLATQVQLSNIEYIAPAVAAGAASAGSAVGAGAAAGGGAAAGASSGITGNIGRGIGRIFGESAEGAVPQEGLFQGGSFEERLIEEAAKSEEEQREGETSDKMQPMGRAKNIAKQAAQKEMAMQHHARTIARAQKMAQQVKQIKTLLQVGKVGGALASLTTLGITLLITILIWIGQFIGHYIMGIELIPGYDWVDYALMFLVVFLIGITLLPIIITAGIICEVDITGLMC